MKLTEIKVSSNGTGMGDALALTEQFALSEGLSGKELLHLRLLAEELIGMMRGIAGDIEAVYSIEGEGKKYALHLKSEVRATRQLRDQLIAVSTKGENASARGFMGKIREMIAVALLPKNDGLSFMETLSLGMISAAGSTTPDAQMLSAENFNWSLSKYKNGIGKESDDSKKAWDELEKSIVASIADEVVVRVAGSCAEITICKAF